MNEYDVIAAVDACLALRDITVTFLYMSPQPPLRSWTWLYHQKGNKMAFWTICCPYRNILNFSRMSRIHFSLVHPFKPMELSAHKHTDWHIKVKTLCPPVSVRSLGGHNYSHCVETKQMVGCCRLCCPSYIDRYRQSFNTNCCAENVQITNMQTCILATQDCFTAQRILSGTTQVSQYQEKHSQTVNLGSLTNSR